MSETPLSPEEAAQMLDSIDQRFKSQSRQILLLSFAVLALAASVALIQWKLARSD